jgi:hypothetical protein
VKPELQVPLIFTSMLITTVEKWTANAGSGTTGNESAGSLRFRVEGIPASDESKETLYQRLPVTPQMAGEGFEPSTSAL